jgi:hypothetical protein
MAEPSLVYHNGFFILDGVKLFRVCRVTGRLEFYDKDKERSHQRGSALVYKNPHTFVRELLLILSSVSCVSVPPGKNGQK